MKKKEGGKRIPMTVLFDPDIRRALRLEKANKDVDMSDLVNDAVRKALRIPAQARVEAS